MDKKFLENIRIRELNQASAYFPPGCKILEIGAGAGWQARQLTAAGFDVSAIDIKQTSPENYNYEIDRVFDVKVYDGRKIPFPDHSFDVVFSSNVLEHIPHVRDFQGEIKRVLKADGICVHILPTTHWKLWSLLTHYPQFIRSFLRNRTALKTKNGLQPVKIKSQSHRPLWRKLTRNLVASRHGETGNTFSELYLFSRARWTRLFKSTGWVVKEYITNRLFYTGDQIFGSRLPFTLRTNLRHIFGSACHVFVLKKTSITKTDL